jgi:hypothetical protein
MDGHLATMMESIKASMQTALEEEIAKQPAAMLLDLDQERTRMLAQVEAVAQARKEDLERELRAKMAEVESVSAKLNVEQKTVRDVELSTKALIGLWDPLCAMVMTLFP